MFIWRQPKPQHKHTLTLFKLIMCEMARIGSAVAGNSRNTPMTLLIEKPLMNHAPRTFLQFRQMCQLFVVSMLAFSWTNRRFIDSFLIYSNFVWQHAYMRERTANFQSSFICQYDSLKFKRTIDRMNEWKNQNRCSRDFYIWFYRHHSIHIYILYFIYIYIIHISISVPAFKIFKVKRSLVFIH